MQDSIQLIQSLPADITATWRALTDPEQMRRWYFPMIEDFKAEAEFTTQFSVLHEGKQFVHIWKVTSADAPYLLAYSWKYGGYPGETLLEFELSPEGDTTRLILTNSNLLSFEPDVHPELSSENFRLGWQGFMESLTAFVTGNKNYE